MESLERQCPNLIKNWTTYELLSQLPQESAEERYELCLAIGSKIARQVFFPKSTMNAAKRPQRTSGAFKDILKNLLSFSTFSQEEIQTGSALLLLRNHCTRDSMTSWGRTEVVKST